MKKTKDMTENKYLQLLMSIHLQMKQNGRKKELMTVEEVCDHLDISESYLYKLTSERMIPHYKPLNKKLYFKRSQVDAWVFNHSIPMRDDLLDRALITIKRKQS